MKVIGPMSSEFQIGKWVDGSTTGQCLEYFLRNDLLAHLERLCESDKPHGIRCEQDRLIESPLRDGKREFVSAELQRRCCDP